MEESDGDIKEEMTMEREGYRDFRKDMEMWGNEGTWRHREKESRRRTEGHG